MDTRRKETTNWSKATLALKIAKVSVCPYITEKYEKFLLKWPSTELEHLPHFFSEVDADAIHYEMNEWKIKTTCLICPIIFGKLLEIQRNPKSKRLVWKPNKKETKYRGSTLVKSSHFDAVCNICSLKSCIFHAEREGIALDEREHAITNQNDGHTPEAMDSIAKHFWRIGNMFMFHGKETDLMTNTSPADTDPALVFKMMMNCKLFEEDDELYNEVLDARNYLMHTSSQRIPQDDFDNCIEVFNKFVTQFILAESCDTCCHGYLEISMLVILPEITVDKIQLYKQAFKIQKDAITYDIHISGRLDISAHTLQSILSVIDSKITHSNYTADTDQDLRDENEQLRQDLSAQRNEHYTSSAENQDLRNEIKRLRRLITDMQSEINEKTQHKSTPEGGDSGGAAVVGATGGATTGAVFGAVAGPPGMVIGGALGALFGGIGGILSHKS